MTAQARIESGKKTYATRAKVEHAIKMAHLAGIDRIGAIELAPDGTIRIHAAGTLHQAPSVEDEIAQWRARRGK